MDSKFTTSLIKFHLHIYLPNYIFTYLVIKKIRVSKVIKAPLTFYTFHLLLLICNWYNCFCCYDLSAFLLTQFNNKNVTAVLYNFRREMMQWNVSVSVVEPALYKTNLMTSEYQAKKSRAKWATLPQSIQEDYGSEYLEESKCLWFNPMNMPVLL